VTVALLAKVQNMYTGFAGGYPSLLLDRQSVISYPSRANVLNVARKCC